MHHHVLHTQSLSNLISEDKYCKSMPITQTSARVIAECQMICTLTPGCLFFNVKESDLAKSVLCHYADPLSGQVVSTPDNVQGWSIYLLD